MQLNEKKEANRECLGAFRRGEIQSNNKLWVQVNELSIKLPRKNAVGLIEADQAKLMKLIDSTRAEIKSTARELLALQPNLTDMDPVTAKLLLAEQAASSKTISEEDEENSD